MVTIQVEVHPFASVTTYSYVLADKPDCNPVPLYGGVPPLAEISAEPSLPPKQVTLLTRVQVAINCVGWVTTDSQVDVHPFASVTVTVYVPAVSPLMLDEVAVLLHR